MNHPDLQQFARQLVIWTELIIDNGRTPFRRVDLYPEIYTAQGVLQPPIVFWINRQSLMAGGILLLPEQDLEIELQYGRRCCEALGLRHFVTWESDRVRIWQVAADKTTEYQGFSFTHADHPDTFRHLLSDVLEALKLSAVIGMVPAAELSADYLNNLYLTTLNLALPPLINSYRSQRATTETATPEDADHFAEEANRLLLLQLLALLWHQKLPDAILPEKLSRAIDISLPKLPDSLRQHLCRTASAVPPPLPHESAVCFHHLLLRLRQLSWHQPPERALKSIEQLIMNWYPKPETGAIKADICLYPLAPDLNSQSELALSDSPAFLAATALLQTLFKSPERKLFFGNILQLQLPSQKGLTIYARLHNLELPSRENRHRYAALLRTSWPNRRFRISSSKPLWFWELIHLLGLCKQQKKLLLTLPVEAFQTVQEDPLWQLFFEHYALQKIQVLSNGYLAIELAPGQQSDMSVSIVMLSGVRIFSASEQLGRFRSQLLLTLALADEIYSLLDHDIAWPEADLLDEKAKIGLQVYAQTRLGQLLWRLAFDSVGPDLKSPETEYWPRPDTATLKELGMAQTAKQQADPNLLLADLLRNPAVAEIELPPNDKNEISPSRTSDKALKQELIDQLQAEGIPTFPDQYLYFLEDPETITYVVTPPLTVKNELLGQIELADAAGHNFTVYGTELADALLLSAELGKSEIELPVARQQVQFLMEQYRQDLFQLHKYLNGLCHSRLKSSKAARKLTKKIWKTLRLPSLKWLDD